MVTHVTPPTTPSSEQKTESRGLETESSEFRIENRNPITDFCGAGFSFDFQAKPH